MAHIVVPRSDSQMPEGKDWLIVSLTNGDVYLLLREGAACSPRTVAGAWAGLRALGDADPLSVAV